MMEDKIGFNLVGLSTEQFATFEENFKPDQNINLNTKINYRLKREDKQIGVYVTFTFEQRKKAFLKIQVGGHFLIDSKAWESFCNEDKIIFPKEFIAHLSMITIGSARGILHEKTVQTEFSKFIIPLIDVTQMVKDDIHFSLENK